MRKVMIGTPCHSGSVHCRYANSLAGTIALGAKLNIGIYPLFIPGNAMVHSARNEVVQRFMKSDYDDLVFIDADISWDPEHFFRLLNHDVQAVGGTYPYKKNDLQFVMKTADGNPPEADMATGLLRVQGLGMGFFRLTRAAVQHLWDVSAPFKRHHSDEEFRAVFEFTFNEGYETGEDIAMCVKFDTVFCDPTILLEHSGDRQHFGDPVQWLNAVRAEKARLDALEAEQK